MKRYVIKHNGLYMHHASKSGWHNAKWVKDINDARLFTLGGAKNCMYSLFYTDKDINVEYIEVKMLEVAKPKEPKTLLQEYEEANANGTLQHR